MYRIEIALPELNENAAKSKNRELFWLKKIIKNR